MNFARHWAAAPRRHALQDRLAGPFEGRMTARPIAASAAGSVAAAVSKGLL